MTPPLDLDAIREEANELINKFGTGWVTDLGRSMLLVLDALADTKAEIERLREGLRPFAAVADGYLEDLDSEIEFQDRHGIPTGATLGDCRRARDLLKEAGA